MKTVKVTKLDIEKGKKYNPHFCMVARGVKRAFKTKDVSVGLTHFFVAGMIYELPKEVTGYISHWDSDIKIEPFSFELGGK